MTLRMMSSASTEGVSRVQVGVVALTALAPIAWGTTYAVTTQLLPPDRPVFAALVRSLPAGLFALCLTRRLPTGHWWWRVGVLGALNIGAFFPLLFLAAERLPGGVAAVLGAVQPLLVAGFARLAVGERVSRWRLGCAVAGVIGVAMIVLAPTARLNPVGVIAGLGGATVMALGVTLTKRWGRPPGVDSLSLAGWQLAAGGLVLLPFAVVVEGAPPAIDTDAALGYLWLGAVGGLFAYWTWFRGIVKLPVTAASLLSLLSPVTAALIGTAILGERFSFVQGVGFALTLSALTLGQLARRPRRAGWYRR